MRLSMTPMARRGIASGCLLLCFVSQPAQGQEPPALDGNHAKSERQEPTSGDRAGEEPAVEPAAHEEIRRALQGQAADGQQPKPNADPLLDDVLQMIRRRGSVLDGSVLDPQREASDEPLSPAQPDLRSGPAIAFRAAESLLRSARLLESLPQQDADRQQLVDRLRSEAARCLRQGLAEPPAAIQETH